MDDLPEVHRAQERSACGGTPASALMSPELP